MVNYSLIYAVFAVTLILSIVGDFWLFRPQNRASWQVYLWQLLFWFSLAMGFAVFLAFYFSSAMSVKFLSAYLLEFSLSMDNVFVFILIFAVWALPEKSEHKALFWGIMIAILLRIVFIFAGVRVVEKFSWILYIFGGFLIFTGIKLLFERQDSRNAKHQPSFAERVLLRYLPISRDPIWAHKLWVRVDGKLLIGATGIVIILMAFTDLVFALDSIPSVIGLLRRTNGSLFTEQEILIMYSSNIFAVIGLRPLYLLLKTVSQTFHLLGYAIATILIYVGLDLLLGLFNLHFPQQVFPILLVGSLGATIILSRIIPNSK